MQAHLLDPSTRPLWLRLLGSLLGSTLIAAPIHAQEATIDSVERHVRGERWERAIEDLLEITTDDVDNGLAWFYLAYCHHNLGDLRQALEFSRKAIDFPEVRATTLYNMACAYSVLEELDQAADCLGRARASGYWDLDSMVQDPELANLRAKVDLNLPRPHEYTDLRGPGGVVVPYRVLLPAEFDHEREYSVILSFAPGQGGRLTTDWMIEDFWGEQSPHADWIVVCAVAPERGWLNHPAHHALEALFEKLRRDYRVAGERFHLFGLGTAARPAATYSRMSRRYTASLTVASALCFDGWDDSDFRSMRQVPVHQIVGGDAGYLVRAARRAETGFERHSVRAKLTELEGEGVLPASLRASRAIELCASTARIPAD